MHTRKHIDVCSLNVVLLSGEPLEQGRVGKTGLGAELLGLVAPLH